MALDSKVVWSDGMFLSPEHFLRHERYVESWVEGRSRPQQAHGWGFTSLELDDAALKQGAFAIRSAAGVLPDGTPFDIAPSHTALAPLDRLAEARGARVLLALPRKVGVELQVKRFEAGEPLSRFAANPDPDGALDAVQAEDDDLPVETAAPALRLMLDSEETAEYVTLGVARISEVLPNKQVVLDEHYIPPCLDYRVSSQLTGFITEFVGDFRQRAEESARLLGSPGSSGASEITDFLYLMTLNRYEPWLRHCHSVHGMHPEACFSVLARCAGELATMTLDTRRPVDLPIYDQDALEPTFAPLVQALRDAIRYRSMRRAIELPMVQHRYGMWTADLHDKELLRGAEFVLVVMAAVPPRRLLAEFPSFVTTGPDHEIQGLISNNLRGIELQNLTGAPREIRTYTNAAYFRLDRANDHFKQLDRATSLALRVGGDFPELAMELWAIRQ